MKIRNILFLPAILIFTALLFTCMTTTGIDPAVYTLAEKENKLLEEGWNHLWSNNFGKAKQNFQKVLNVNPENPPALRGIGLSLYSLGKEFEAFDFLNRSVLADPTHPLAVPVMDFLTTEFPFRKSLQEKLLKTNTILSNSPSLWMEREGLRWKENYYQNVDRDLKTLRKTVDRMKYFKNWQLLGPFDNVSRSGFNRAFLDEEHKEVDKLSTTYKGIDNRSFKWFTPGIKSATGVIPVSEYMNSSAYSVVYARNKARIVKPGDYLFMVSYKGAIKVWFDGEPVYSDPDYRTGSEMLWFTRSLEKGDFRILIKLCNTRDQADFSFSMLDVNNTIASGLAPEPPVGFLLKNDNSFNRHPGLYALKQMLVNNPGDDECSFWISYFLNHRGFTYEAQELVKGRLHTDTKSALFQLSQAWTLMNQENNVDALNLLRNIQKKIKFFTPAARFLISDLIERKSPERAGQLAREMLMLNEVWFYGLEAQILVSAQKEDWNVMEEVLKIFKTHYPDAPGYLFSLLDGSSGYDPGRVEANYISHLYNNGRPLQADLYLLNKYQNRGSYSGLYNLTSNLLNFYPENQDYREIFLEAMLIIKGSGGYNTYLTEFNKMLTSFPHSLSLLMDKYRQDESDYFYLINFKEENSGLRSRNFNSGNRLDIEITNKRAAMLDAMKKILNINPGLFDIRKSLREYNNETAFNKQIRIFETIEVIEDFEKKSGDRDWNADAVIVLNDRHEMFFGDGGRRSIEHKIIKVFSEQGIKQMTTQFMEYQPYYDDVDILEAEVLKSDGSRVSASRLGSRISFRGLGKGDYIILRYSADTAVPGELNREYWSAMDINSYYPVYKMRYTLLYPEDNILNIKKHNIGSLELEESDWKFGDDYKLYSLEAEDVPPIKYEPLLPGRKDVICWVDISTINDWTPIQSWYRRLYEGRCEVTPKIGLKTGELITGLVGEEDIIKKLYDFVAREIIYEDLSFMYSAYIPQEAESVLEDGYGDCKDKATLLITMLKSAGIPAYIALNTPGYYGDHYYLPSNRFNHAIVVVPVDGRDLILDPTVNSYTFLDLPSTSIGSRFLPVKPENEKAVKGFQELPRIESSGDHNETFILTELTAGDTEYKLSGTIVYNTFYAGFIRSLLETQNREEKRQTFSTIMNSSIAGFRLMDYNEKDIFSLFHPPVIDFTSSIPDPNIEFDKGILARKLPWIITVPLPLTGTMMEAERENPLLIDDPSTAFPVSQTIISGIPGGYKLLSIPDNLNVSFKDAEVSFSYRQKDDKLICKRRYFIPKMVIPAREIEEFNAFIMNITHKQDEGVLFIKK